MSITCPKCGYERRPGDPGPVEECPRCGIIYAKYRPPVQQPPQNQATEKSPSPAAAEPPLRAHPFAPDPALPPEPKPLKVVVVDFDVSFWQMVWLMVKLVIASIPAMIILGVLCVGFVTSIAGLGWLAGIR